MIQIFKELQKETENIKFIKTVDGENPQHYFMNLMEILI